VVKFNHRFVVAEGNTCCPSPTDGKNTSHLPLGSVLVCVFVVVVIVASAATRSV
jgi:hypothetical protein